MRKNRLKGEAKERAAASCLSCAAAITGPARAAAGTTPTGSQVARTGSGGACADWASRLQAGDGSLVGLHLTDTNLGACAVAQTPRSGAEARGFEPRKGANPNRISSAVPGRTAPGGRGQETAQTQVSGHSTCRDEPASPRSPRRGRAQSVRTSGSAAGHRSRPSPARARRGTAAAALSAAALATSGKTRT
jgi:hypothetical protein